MGKYLVLKVTGKTIAVEEPVRVLEPYEFRRVDGTLVNAVHLGDQLADLGILLGLEKTRQSNALLLCEGFGVLIDSVDETGVDDNESLKVLPKLLTQQKGSLILGTIVYKGMTVPVLTKKPGKHLVNELEKEKAERVWI